MEGDADALPVLIALLADSDSDIRYYSILAVTAIQADGRPALFSVQVLAHDRATVYERTVAEAAADCICCLERRRWY